MSNAERLDTPDDPINPKHYNQFKHKPIDVVEDWNLPHHLATAVCYIARAEHKGEPKQDIEKALWYVKRYLGFRFGKDQAT